MPYVDPETRSYFDEVIETMPNIVEKGELTYLIARLQMRFAECPGTLPNYQRHSDAVAAAADAAHEYRRKVLDPYEDTKAAKNGDIYAIYGGTERL